MRPALLLAFLALTACTPMQWTRQDASADQAEKDAQECKDLAYKQVQAKPSARVAPLTVQDSFGRAQNLYPSGVFADPQGDRFIEEGRIASDCMRSRGYQLTRK